MNDSNQIKIETILQMFQDEFQTHDLIQAR